MADNDDCNVFTAAFPDGERESLTLGELKKLKQIAKDLTPMSKGPKAEEPKRSRR